MSQTSINQRISSILIQRKITYQVMAHSIGVTPQAVEQWVNGKTTPSEKAIFKIICAYKDIDARWLITGEGVERGEQDPHVLNDSGCQDYGKILELFESKFETKYELKVEECGMLKERVRQLTEEIQRLKGGSGREPVMPRSRTG